MIKFESTEVSGWEAAIRGMRNPKNSWARSDSYWTHIEDEETHQTANFEYFVGDNDLKLMKDLASGGSVHGKFLRWINVTVDITAPMYWWKEFETYRNVIADNPFDIEMNSCSTMFKIMDKEFERSDFSYEHLGFDALAHLDRTIDMLNYYRRSYINWDNIPDNVKIANGWTEKKDIWWQIIQSLPMSYHQKRTLKLNYSVLMDMYEYRRLHKLDEWRELGMWIEELPYSEIITDPVYEKKVN